MRIEEKLICKKMTGTKDAAGEAFATGFVLAKGDEVVGEVNGAGVLVGLKFAGAGGRHPDDGGSQRHCIICITTFE